MIRSKTIRDNKAIAFRNKLEAKRKKLRKPLLIHVIVFNCYVLVGAVGSYAFLMDVIKTFSVISMICLPLCLILLAIFTKPTIELNQEYFK